MSAVGERYLAGRVNEAAKQALADELRLRLDIARLATMEAKRIRPNDEWFSPEKEYLLVESALASYPDAEAQIVARYATIERFEASEHATATAPPTPTPQPLPEEDVCNCCEPPVALSRHTHAPIKGIREQATPEAPAPVVELYDGPLGPRRYTRVRPDTPHEREVTLGADARVYVVVTGKTWSAKETLRDAGLRWNEKQGPDAAWDGRVGPKGLALLAALEDTGDITLDIREGAGNHELPPPRRSAHAMPGRDFY